MFRSPRPDVVAAWSRIAPAYQVRYEIPCAEVTYGPMCPDERSLQLLGSLEGRRVLDVGCGGGQNSIAMARKGAQVVALDPCQPQIEFASELATRHGVSVDFRLAGAEQLDRFTGPFDLVVSCYALMFVEGIEAFFHQVRRLLVPGGMFVVSVDHPMRLSGRWADVDKFIVDDYFATGWQSWNYEFPESGVNTTMHRFHRTMQQWFASVTGAGMRVVELLEPLPPDVNDSFGTYSRHGRDSVHNIFNRDRLRRVPGTLILKGLVE